MLEVNRLWSDSRLIVVEEMFDLRECSKVLHLHLSQSGRVAVKTLNSIGFEIANIR